MSVVLVAQPAGLTSLLITPTAAPWIRRRSRTPLLALLHRIAGFGYAISRMNEVNN